MTKREQVKLIGEGMNATERLTRLSQLIADHEAAIREELRTLDKATAAMAEYRKATGYTDPYLHLNTVIYYLAKKRARGEGQL